MKTNLINHGFCSRFHLVIGLLLTIVLSARADYQSTVLGDHPLAYFALDLTIDNNGIATDLSGNGNNSAYYNISASAGPSAYLPNAAFFAGSSVQSFVDLSSGANSGILNFGGPITMEAWVQSTNTTQGPVDILAKGDDSYLDYDELSLRVDGGNYYGGTYNSSTGGANASGGVTTTNWTYLVSTFDGTNWNLYVNGQLVSQGADTVGALNFSDPWAIGTGSADGFSRFFAGNICQVALYTYSLTPVQVLAHFYEAELNSAPSNSAPIIVGQPQPQSTFAGGTVTFSVSALSALPTTDQWLKNGVPLPGQTNSTLTLAGVSAASAANYSVVVGNGQGTTNSAPASLTLLTPGNSLRWSPNGNSGVWDTAASPNWINLASQQASVFNANDQVLFDDTAGVPTTVTINGTVAPSILTVNASTNDFTINGSGTLGGLGSLVKQGSSALTIVAAASFTGTATIGGGTVYAGNNSFKAVAAITITNNATLDFGGGTYNTGQPVLISGTGVSGLGALYNSYNDAPGEVFNITLAGDTTFGGSTRWDLVGGSISGPHKVTVNWASGGYGEWNTLAIATNVGDIELASGTLGIKNMGASFGNPSANFIVDAGTVLDFWTGDGGYARNFHVLDNGTLQILTGFTSFGGSLILENGAQFNSFYGSGSQTINGPVTLNGTAHFVLGDANFIFTNVLAGAGGFVWDNYNHELILTAANTYRGVTVIGSGLTLALTGAGSISDSSLIFFGGSNPGNISLDVTGRGDQTLTLASGQTLGGVGEINGNLVAAPGATIAPGGTNVVLGMTEGSSSSGTVSATGTIQLNGTTIIKLNGSGVNDLIQSAGAGITYGGTLSLVNLSGTPLAVGDSFQVFSAGNYAGSFANLSPASPGPGLAWDTSQLNSSGVLNVIAGNSVGPVITSSTVAGGNLIFGGTGGSPNASYTVFTTASLNSPNWVPLLTNTFDAFGGFSVTNAINQSTPQQFYLIH